MEGLYMFAIMPPEELTAKIEAERKRFAEKYKCYRALKPPVHITLFPPFKAAGEVEKQLLVLNDWVAHQTAFIIELKDFDFFNNLNKPVAYIDVEQNEALEKLQQNFNRELVKQLNVPIEKKKYRPHFTIGYRDVPPALMPEITQEYSSRTFEGSFICDAVCFWKHDRRNWQVIQKFKFGSKTGSAEGNN